MLWRARVAAVCKRGSEHWGTQLPGGSLGSPPPPHLLLILQPQPEELAGSWRGVEARNQLAGPVPLCWLAFDHLSPYSAEGSSLLGTILLLLPTASSAGGSVVSKTVGSGAARPDGTDLKSWGKENSLYCVSK